MRAIKKLVPVITTAVVTATAIVLAVKSKWGNNLIFGKDGNLSNDYTMYDALVAYNIDNKIIMNTSNIIDMTDDSDEMYFIVNETFNTYEIIIRCNEDDIDGDMKYVKSYFHAMKNKHDMKGEYRTKSFTFAKELSEKLKESGEIRFEDMKDYEEEYIYITLYKKPNKDMILLDFISGLAFGDCHREFTEPFCSNQSISYFNNSAIMWSEVQ